MKSGSEDLAERLWPEELQGLQDALSRAFSVPLLVAEPSGRPLSACEDLAQFCRRFTRRVILCRPCLECGRADASEDIADSLSDRERSPTAVHTCPLGVADVVLPVYSAGEKIGYLLSAQVVVGGREQTANAESSKQRPADGEDLAALLTRCARLSWDQMGRLEHGLSAVACLLGALASARRRNLRLAERVREQSCWVQQHTTADTLTGVPNRRRFMESLTGEINRARRYRRAISLAVIGIEDFREMNDEFGHEVGDAVLVAVAECVTGTLRQTDFIGRLGGSTFGALLPETVATQAMVALRRVSAAIANLNASGDLPVEVRVAVGIVDQVAEAQEMLEAAHRAATRARGLGAPAVCCG